MKIRMLFTLVILGLFSCTHEGFKEPVKIKTEETKPTKSDTNQTSFIIKGSKKTDVVNGESVEYYKNGSIKMRGMMKDGKRDGLWKSWYEDGTPWSATTFAAGIKNGKTTTWYENGKKRYEGFYTNDNESGKWTYWNDKGTIVNTPNYDKK
jgi:hypothetical protein